MIEAIKTLLNAIMVRFRHVQANVDAVQANVDAVQANVDAVSDRISSGIRTETIADAINFPQSMKVKAGTVVIDDSFVVKKGSYGAAFADHALKLKCYCSASGSYTTYLTVNGVKQNVTLEYLSYNEFALVFPDGDNPKKKAFIQFSDSSPA